MEVEVQTSCVACNRKQQRNNRLSFYCDTIDLIHEHIKLVEDTVGFDWKKQKEIKKNMCCPWMIEMKNWIEENKIMDKSARRFVRSFPELFKPCIFYKHWEFYNFLTSNMHPCDYNFETDGTDQSLVYFFDVYMGEAIKHDHTRPCGIDIELTEGLPANVLHSELYMCQQAMESDYKIWFGIGKGGENDVDVLRKVKSFLGKMEELVKNIEPYWVIRSSHDRLKELQVIIDMKLM